MLESKPISPPSTREIRRDAQGVQLEGPAIRRRIEQIKRAIVTDIFDDESREKVIAPLEINSSLEILDKEQELLLNKEGLSNEEFSEQLDKFVDNYRRVLEYLAGKYGSKTVGEIIKKRQVSVKSED
jgi:predicted Mrr-cat superfamily restriction endonuclease